MLPDIEEIVMKELNGLCGSCIHLGDCVYHRRSDKLVIQCELFESRVESVASVEDVPLKGLCLNCSKAPFCHLLKETSGVWHCEEYE